jgi:hypothetical protein
LPPNWTTLYELTKLTDEQFDNGIETGKINPELERKAAIGAARAIAPGRAEPSDSLDYFPTPPWATRALFDYVLPHLRVPHVRSAWDPACGEGHMAEAMRAYVTGPVHATDIFDYGYGDDVLDYLAEPRRMPDGVLGVSWIITNPPFKGKTEAFIQRALAEAGDGVAMFVRLQWLETIGRYERIFRDRPPTLIAFFAERVPLCKGEWNPAGDTATAYIWLVWMRDRVPQAPFWIPPNCRETCSRPDDVERFTARPVIKKDHLLRTADDGSLTDPDTGEIQESETPAEPLPAHTPNTNDQRASVKSESESSIDVPTFLLRSHADCVVGKT